MAPREPDERGVGPTDRTRRQWLLALGAGAAAGLAGCSSDGGGDSEEDADDDDESNDETDSPGSRGSPADATGETGTGCPSSFDYVTRQYSAFGQSDPIGECEVPESARIQSVGSGLNAILEWDRQSFTSFGVACTFSPDPEFEGGTDPTVEGEVEFITENTPEELTRVTGQYEMAASGAVVLVSETTTGGDDGVPRTTHVVVDHPDGVMSVDIGATDTSDCPGAPARIHRRIVESQRPV